jgi:hypothetical protein
VVEPVKPPLQETLPSEQRSLQAIQQKFWELQQQVRGDGAPLFSWFGWLVAAAQTLLIGLAQVRWQCSAA